MAYHSIEGTWDEVIAHADEFVGHRVRVTILDEEESKQKSLAELLRGKTGTVSFDAPPARESGKAFTDILVEKHEKPDS